MLGRAATNAYSWWWASHIRTKQSKWLEQSLLDMEEIVAETLKIIDDNGDSFAQRAEMYYRKKPELLNFVEEAFRAYRALAEKYDHLSRELQSANRTIATVFPEQVHYRIDEEDEDDDERNDPKTNSTSADSNNQTEKQNIPKVPDIPKKDFRSPSMLLSRKGPMKRNASSKKSFSTTQSSGLSKVEALAEIDKLQKNILALQTEKEFVRSLYEHSYEKYWEIEDKITGMQKRVCSLQDEFCISTVIEDNDVRGLMAATALNSCKDTLAKLQEVHAQSSEEAIAACERFKEAHDKFETLREHFISKHKIQQEKETEPKSEDGEEIASLEEDMDEHDVVISRKRIEEKFEEDLGNSLSMTEIAERIDELVSKVVSLETAVTSQTGLVKRLRSEADELHTNIQNLEEDKEMLIEDSENTNKKLRELEEELKRVKILNQNVKSQDNSLQTHFTEANCNLEHLSGTLKNVKLDEEGESIELNKNTSIPNGKQSEEFEKYNDELSTDKLETMNDIETTNEEKEDHAEVLNDATNEDKSKLKEDIELSTDNFAMMNDVKTTNEEKEDHAEVLNEATNEDKSKLKEDIEFSTDNLAIMNDFKTTKEENVDHAEILNDATNEDKSKLKEDIEFSTDNLAIMNDVKTTQEEKEDHPEIIDDVANEDGESKLKEDIDFKNEDILEIKEKDKDDLSETMSNIDIESLDLGTGEEKDEANLRQQMFVNGSDDREKILLEEYTSVLKNYNDVNVKLNDVEKKNRNSIFELAIQVRELKNVVATKDKEINILQQKLTSSETDQDESPSTTFTEHKSTPQEELLQNANLQEPEIASSDIVSTSVEDQPQHVENTGNIGMSTRRIRIEIVKANQVDKHHSLSPLEKKFRTEIDDLQEENLEFWLRFSTSVHQIQKFQNSIQDIKAELMKIKGSNNNATQSETKAIFRQLREIRTELSLWLEHNEVLQEELQGRHPSLCSLQDEITRAAVNPDSASKKVELSEYQATKFQGEVLNMKQENNKVSSELQSGLSYVKGLKIDVEKVLDELSQAMGVNNHDHMKHSTSRARIPLKSFLFGIKLKKQRQSVFSCVTPTLQRKYSDLDAANDAPI